MSFRNIFSSPVILLVALLVALPLTSLETFTSQAQGDDFSYTVVGGLDGAQSYPDQAIEGFNVTDFTYQSLYPDGLEFKATIHPPEGVRINQVVLFFEFSTGRRSRFPARLGDEPNEWVAIPYEGGGLPPWHEMEVFWGIRASDDLQVDTEPVHVVYYDPTREWYRTENDVVIVYWYGMPTELGQIVSQGMVENWPRYEAVFGAPLPYKVMSVIYPPGPDWNEFKADTSVDDTEFGATGQLFSDAATSVQRVRTLEPATVRENCIWNPPEPSIEHQMRIAASTLMHESGHVHQQEFGVLLGPIWWTEGQATFLELYEEYPIDERLSNLARLMDGPFPTLMGVGPSGGPYTAAEDGCTHLAYDIGASFQKWLAESKGIDTYSAIVAELGRTGSVQGSIETITGQSLVELENEWRAAIGISLILPEQIDPALALAPPAEPYLAEGDTVIMPAPPFSQPMYSEPRERSLSKGACFANSPASVLRVGNDGVTNWYEVDCMGLIGWMNQSQLEGAQ